MRIELAHLDLGADTAEQDIARGLPHYFYPNSAYEKILSRKKSIIVGNRGAGKSAIFRYAAREHTASGAIVIELSPDEYSYEYLSRLLEDESAGSWGKSGAFAAAWQYLIYNLVFKELIRRNHSKLLRGDYERIYNYVRDNLRLESLSPIAMLLSYLKRLERIKIGSLQGELEIRELQSLYHLEEIRELLPSLQQVLKKQKVSVFVDELDHGWDNSADSHHFITGLFHASQKINALSDNMTVYLSIRRELFDSIPQIYDDAQKIRDRIEVLRWNRDELLEMFARRIKYRLPKTARLSNLQVWRAVFGDELSEAKARTHDYILDRTHHRPRELLQFCRRCIECASGPLMDEDAILRAEPVYSEERIRDTDSEYKYQFPHLFDVFSTFRGGPNIFERDELDLHLLEITEGKIGCGRARWAQGMDYADLKRVLWLTGFLLARQAGAKTSAKTATRRRNYFCYFEMPHVQIDEIKKLQIHPAFGSFLGLRKRRRKAADE